MIHEMCIIEEWRDGVQDEWTDDIKCDCDCKEE